MKQRGTVKPASVPYTRPTGTTGEDEYQCMHSYHGQGAIQHKALPKLNIALTSNLVLSPCGRIVNGVTSIQFCLFE